MARMTLVLYPGPRLHPGSPVRWFLMQIGMIAGTSLPGQPAPG
jgi:hypothetical protein